ncbi:MAG TPA: OmpA family protein [Pseudolabrys sp.]|nr:OmpA family protein [Pseudolabrys sp.]
MSEGQKAFWLGAGLVIVLAVSGVTLWQVVENPTAGIKTQLAALTTKVDATAAKLDKTDASLGEVRKATASDAIGKGLGQLEAKLKTVNDALDASVKTISASLAGIQKSLAAGDVDGRLDALGADVKNINASLGKLPQAAAVQDISAQLEALNANIKRTDASLTQIKQALGAQNVASRIAPLDAKLTTVSDTLAEIKKTDSLDSVSKELSALFDKLDETNKALADIKLADSRESVRKELAALAGKLDSTNKVLGDIRTPAAGSKVQGAVGDLQKNIADAAALHDKLAQDIGKLEAALKPKPREMMVVYLHMPNADKLPKTIATVSPLDIEFAHVGSTDDDGQAAAIIPKLKQIVGSQSGCVISVAGYADTLGGDKTNLTLSKKRARAIAEKIKTAFAGTDVQVNEAAWGERRLHDWTPDNMAKEANRRVDIAVNCEK